MPGETQTGTPRAELSLTRSQNALKTLQCRSAGIIALLALGAHACGSQYTLLYAQYGHR